jgi:TonB family protein
MAVGQRRLTDPISLSGRRDLGMLRRSAMIASLILLAVGLLLPPSVLAQQITLVKLHPPTYPPLANNARIQGDVELALRIRPDGSVDSATVLKSTHPWLAEAASESARRSQFDCRGCTEAAADYTFLYSFRSGKYLPDACSQASADAAEFARTRDTGVSISGSHITVTGPSNAGICSTPTDRPIPRFRSARCLYLWKCRPGQLVD